MKQREGRLKAGKQREKTEQKRAQMTEYTQKGGCFREAWGQVEEGKTDGYYMKGGNIFIV